MQGKTQVEARNHQTFKENTFSSDGFNSMPIASS